MRALSTFAAAVAGAVLVCASSAIAIPGGPTSPLYITSYGEFNGGTECGLDIVQGLTTSSHKTLNPTDICIACAGDVRTFGYTDTYSGSQFDLAGNLQGGGPYTNSYGLSQFHDGTSDGAFNYTVDWPSGTVLRYSTNWTSPAVQFNVTPGTAGWITMNAADGSFWLSMYGGPDLVEHRTNSGALISSFNSGVFGSQGLALDPIDGTLWMSQGFTLYQFDQAGNAMQNQNQTYAFAAGQWYGMEFDTTVPEPSVLGGVIMLTWSLKRPMTSRGRS